MWSRRGIISLGSASATVRRWANERPRVNYQLIVTLSAGGCVIGCAGLRQAGYPLGEAEVGIELDPDH